MSQSKPASHLSLDTWAVLLVLAVTIAIRIGIVTAIPW